MRDKFMTFCVVVFVVLIVIFAIRILHEEPLTGKVTKLWSENGGIHGQNDYALVETTDGKRTVIGLFPWEYGTLDIGMTCTFQIDYHSVAQSMQCEDAT